jgi:peptidoglycan/LPS O-acetylase OafA/YrhL
MSSSDQEQTKPAGLRIPALFKAAPVSIDYIPGKFVREFDGWRGVGIVFVVLAHYFPGTFLGSWVFMEMFFVMSGFLITGILIGSKGKAGYYSKFMKRRILRVFPLYYLCLVLLLWVLPLSWMDLSYYRTHQAWFWLYMENWLYAKDGWPPVRGLHHFWSLAIEEQFYIVWPLVVWMFSTRGLIRCCIFLFFFSILFRITGMNFGFVMPFPYVATLGRMEGITLGALIAILVRTADGRRLLEAWAKPVSWIFGCLSLLVFLLARSMQFQHPYHYLFNYTFVDLFFAGMITLTLCSKELIGYKRLLNQPVIKQLGIMSYCIYIFHYPIQTIVEQNFTGYFLNMTGSTGLAKLACLGLAFLITVPVVWIIHKKIELPLWNVKKRIPA